MRKKKIYPFLAAIMAALVALAPCTAVFAADSGASVTVSTSEESTASFEDSSQQAGEAASESDSPTGEIAASSESSAGNTAAVSADTLDTVSSTSGADSTEVAGTPVLKSKKNVKSASTTNSLNPYKPAGSSAPQTAVTGHGGLSIRCIPYSSGYGDAVMVSSDGKNLLMDTYSSGANSDLKNWLKSNGYTTFDIYISHYHDDHIGNIISLINDSSFKISSIYLPDPSYMNGSSGNTYMNNYISQVRKIFETVKSKGIKVVYLTKGSTFAVGNASFTVLWGCSYTNSNHDTHYINNNSLVTKVTCGSVRYLTCGDIESATENQIINAGVDVSADIYKLSHHGGNTSNTSFFVKKVNPIFAFYNYNNDSSSKFSPKGSWSAAPVANLKGMANIYSVRYNGEIDISADNGLIRAACGRNYVTKDVSFQDKASGKVTKVTYRLNKASSQHIPDRLYTLSGTIKPSESSRPSGNTKQGFVTANGKTYYYENGNMLKNVWKQVEGSWYYFGTDGHMYHTWSTINGKLYNLGSNGKMLTGWQKLSELPYKKADGKQRWYYFGSDGAVRKGWQTISGKKYYFDNNGVMLVGRQKIGGKWYGFNSDGSMQEGVWYQNKYYVDGKAVTGWYKVKGKQMYFDPKTTVRVTGWQTISGKKYYFDKYGVMVTGKQKISGKTYTFGSDGVLKTSSSSSSKIAKNGWSQNRYYINGKAVSGWYKVKGKQMYFNPKTKIRVTGRQKIGGKWYTFDKYGVLKK